jgi:acyl-CoA synthetase (AMP-forming)/AMP-acid ligase II
MYPIFDRWKGENVATAEVESVIMGIIGLKDAAVYGVQVSFLFLTTRKDRAQPKHPKLPSFKFFHCFGCS